MPDLLYIISEVQEHTLSKYHDREFTKMYTIHKVEKNIPTYV